MKGKGVICLFVFVIALINALTIVAIGSSETLTGDTNYSGHEKAFDPGIMNLSIKPGDDFYEYVDGAWIKNHPVPADKSRYGEFEILTDRNYDSIKIIIENAANNTSAPEGSLEQKIGEFYRVGMDNATIEILGSVEFLSKMAFQA